MKKVLYSNEPDDYGYDHNVVLNTEFCCERFKEDFQFGFGEYNTLDLNRYVNKINYNGSNIDYCPYCGEKIEIELDTTEEEQYLREKSERERRYREYLKSLPPTPKHVIRKNKKDALTDYQKIFPKQKRKKVVLGV